MTVQDVIDGFQEDAKEDARRNSYADILFQEAVRIGMELNNQYHTPEEIREIMGRLTGKKVDSTFRLFPPFYTDFGKNITIGKDVFINSGCHFQDQGGITIGDGSLPMRLCFLVSRLATGRLWLPGLWYRRMCRRLLWWAESRPGS